MSAADNDNANPNPDNIFFTIKDRKLYIPVTLSAKDNQTLLKLLSKGFESLIYWNEYKTKSQNKNTTNEFRYVHEPKFLRVNKLSVVVYPNRNVADDEVVKNTKFNTLDTKLNSLEIKI